MIHHEFDNALRIVDNVARVGRRVTTHMEPAFLRAHDSLYIFDGSDRSMADNLAGISHRVAQSIIAAISDAASDDDRNTITTAQSGRLADCFSALLESIRIAHGRGRMRTVSDEITRIMRSDAPLADASIRALQTLQHLTADAARRSARSASDALDPTRPLSFEPDTPGVVLSDVADKLISFSRSHDRTVSLKFNGVAIEIGPHSEQSQVHKKYRHELAEHNFSKRDAPTGL